MFKAYVFQVFHEDGSMRLENIRRFRSKWLYGAWQRAMNKKFEGDEFKFQLWQEV